MSNPQPSDVSVSVWKELLGVETDDCCHTVNRAGEQRLEVDQAALAPGIDCCAVCASGDANVTCEVCKQVKYCGAEHQESDAEKHGRVCGILSKHAGLSGVELSDEELELAVGQLLDACDKAKKPVGSWEALFDTLAVSPEAEDSSATKHAGGAAATADATHSLAVAASTSSYLSGPLTLAHALTSAPELQQLVSSCREAKAPLRVAVLGAGKAECAHWDAWKAVGVLVGCPLLLQLVGPEVPDHLHLAVKRLEHDVTLAFYMRAFEELVGAMERRWAALPNELQGEPQLLLGIHMGLTCPEYRWGRALAAAERIARRAVAPPASPAPAANGTALTTSSPSPADVVATATVAAAPTSPAPAATAAGAADSPRPAATPGAAANTPAAQPARTPLLLLSTASTQPEAYEESVLLQERGWALASEPASNPFPSLEVLQSRTMANDVYRKSAWLALHAVAAARPAKRKSWGEWAVDVVQGIKGLITPSKKRPCPSPARASSAAEPASGTPAAVTDGGAGAADGAAAAAATAGEPAAAEGEGAQ